jgi:transcriptional regulator with XRE-family HTH domain
MFMDVVKHALPVRSIPLNLISAKILYMDTGERIKQARKRLDLTQEAFGKLAGVSKAAVSYWESGQTKPERDALLSLKRKRGISPEWVTSGKGEMFDAITGAETIEAIPAWELLTQKQRQIFAQQIEEQAAENQAIRQESAPPIVHKRTVNVSERRLKKANPLHFSDRRKKGAENA